MWAYFILKYSDRDITPFLQFCRNAFLFISDLNFTQGTEIVAPDVHAHNWTRCSKFFGNRDISKDPWPERPLHLTSTHFSLSVLLKGEVYTNKPHTINDLKENTCARRLQPFLWTCYNVSIVSSCVWVLGMITYSECTFTRTQICPCND
jgi:hypothetical protein